MPVAWGFCPYEVVTDTSGTYRRCAAEKYRADITTDGGALAYAEILGDYAIVKVRASAETLLAMDAEPGFLAVPRHVDLQDTLADFSAGEKTVMQNKLLALGYTAGQLQAGLGANLNAITLGQLLRFAASRWRRPSGITGGVTVFEGADWPRSPRTIKSIDEAVN